MPSVELSYFLAKYCIQGTPFLWMGSVKQFRVDKWSMDAVHTKENAVGCHINSFSLVFFFTCFDARNLPLVQGLVNMALI